MHLSWQKKHNQVFWEVKVDKFFEVLFLFSVFLLSQVLAKQQIGWLTAQAWFSENKQLEEKVSFCADEFSFEKSY